MYVKPAARHVEVGSRIRTSNEITKAASRYTNLPSPVLHWERSGGELSRAVPTKGRAT
jgi:hypothetical protein